MHIQVRNCNQAFDHLVSGIANGFIKTIATPSRYGDVLRIAEPVTVTYNQPRERVLFNPRRDCNCFFHLFESLWMLAGRNDVRPLEFYNPKIREFSDNSMVFQAAYGYRWRSYFGWDQLPPIIRELKNNPTTRRAVLGIWNSTNSNIDGQEEPDHDFHFAINGGKDVPCNTHAYFDVVDGKVNMTVCNRSNDLVWGMLGANVVHFSLLQEYIANCAGYEVGVYHQFTNNLHVYTNTFEPRKWLLLASDRTMWDAKETEYAKDVEDQTINGGILPSTVKLVYDHDVFDAEVAAFIDNPYQTWDEPFLETIAKPMCQAFQLHKDRQYDKALEMADRVHAPDWSIAARQWIERRRANWEEKHGRSTAASSDSVS